MSHNLKPPNDETEMSEAFLVAMLANPIYCLRSVPEIFTEDKDPLISEEKWIGAAENLIKEIGARAFLRKLLDNLKGESECWENLAVQ